MGEKYNGWIKNEHLKPIINGYSIGNLDEVDQALLEESVDGNGKSATQLSKNLRIPRSKVTRFVIDIRAVINSSVNVKYGQDPVIFENQNEHFRAGR